MERFSYAMINRKRELSGDEPNSQDTDYDGTPRKSKEPKRDYSFRVRELIAPKPLSPGHRYMKIISWNVNGLRPLAINNRKCLQALVEKYKPDILCFQETKIQDGSISDYDMLLPGYDSFWNCSTVKKGYSGTAVFVNKKTVHVPRGLVHSGSSARQTKLSALWKKGIMQPVSDDDLSDAESHPAGIGNSGRPTIVEVSYDFDDVQKAHAGEGRTITLEFDRFILVACYVPNSGEGLKRLEYRVNEWEPHMRAYLRTISARKPVVFTGDLNCSHLDIDLNDPLRFDADQLRGHTPQERAAFTRLLQETGFRDAFRHFYPDAKGQFTFWDQYIASNRPHNKGVRLDYFLCSGDMFSPHLPAAPAEQKMAATEALTEPQVQGVSSSSSSGTVPAGAAAAAPEREAAATEFKAPSVLPVPPVAATAGAVAGNIEPPVVHDAYILYADTVGVSDHCPIILILRR